MMIPGFPGDSGGGYGAGGGSCTSIVETSITTFGGDGTVKSGPPVVGAVLPVDGAISPDGRYMAIAVAGAFEDQTFFFGSSSEGMGVIMVDQMAEIPQGECVVAGSSHPGGMIGSGQTIAVAFDSAGSLVVQTREPNRLRIYEAGCVAGCVPMLDISLGGEARRDTGHDLFHANAGGGLACASCHPGGGDDGRTWHFKNLAARAAPSSSRWAPRATRAAALGRRPADAQRPRRRGVRSPHGWRRRLPADSSRASKRWMRG